MTTRLLITHALSPLHAGTGQSVGAIELAIARDRATNHPYLPASSLKGALRARAVDQWDEPDVFALFGPDTEHAADHAGSVLFGDANLLLLPVRSVAGTFAWVTSHYLLHRFARDCAEAGRKGLPLPAPPESLEECRITSKSALKVPVQGKARVVFEDLDLQPSGSSLDALASMLGELVFPGDDTWQSLLEQRLCVVHDDVMSFFALHGTDVVARVALKHESKTVANLWHEESLPAETVLVSLVTAAPHGKTGKSAAKLIQGLDGLLKGSVQLGGKATVGRGRCRLYFGGVGGGA